MWLVAQSSSLPEIWRKPCCEWNKPLINCPVKIAPWLCIAALVWQKQEWSVNLTETVPWVPNAVVLRGGEGPHERACVGNAGHGWSLVCSATVQIPRTLRGSTSAGSSGRSNHSWRIHFQIITVLSKQRGKIDIFPPRESQITLARSPRRSFHEGLNSSETHLTFCQGCQCYKQHADGRQSLCR